MSGLSAVAIDHPFATPDTDVVFVALIPVPVLSCETLFNLPEGLNSPKHLTLLFNAFVFCQIFNEFNARSIGDDANVMTGLARNPVFLSIIIFTVIVQFVMVEVCT